MHPSVAHTVSGTEDMSYVGVTLCNLQMAFVRAVQYRAVRWKFSLKCPFVSSMFQNKLLTEKKSQSVLTFLVKSITVASFCYRISNCADFTICCHWSWFIRPCSCPYTLSKMKGWWWCGRTSFLLWAWVAILRANKRQGKKTLVGVSSYLSHEITRKGDVWCWNGSASCLLHSTRPVQTERDKPAANKRKHPNPCLRMVKNLKQYVHWKYRYSEGEV